MRELKIKVIDATVNLDATGIFLLSEIEKDKRKVLFFSIEDDWLRIPEGKIAAVELQKVCDLLNGYRIVDNEKIPIKGKYPKTLTVKVEEK